MGLLWLSNPLNPAQMGMVRHLFHWLITNWVR
jgi:hypothetical protein